jgi:hypothetical protein
MYVPLFVWHWFGIDILYRACSEATVGPSSLLRATVQEMAFICVGGYIDEGGDIQCVTIRLCMSTPSQHRDISMYSLINLRFLQRILYSASFVEPRRFFMRLSTLESRRCLQIISNHQCIFFLDLHSIHHATTPFKFVSACAIVKKLLSRQHGPEYTVQLLENGDMTMEGSIIYHHLHASIAMLLRRSPKPNFQF